MRETNVQVFEDTRRLSETDSYLKEAIAESSSKQYVVKEEENFETAQGHRFKNPVTVVVSKRRSFEAASRYAGQKICVHNFASSVSPSGGVLRGSTAQEEALCRCSTLYFNISEADIVEEFHDSHKKAIKMGTMDSTYNDDCIYTPDVVVFKSDVGIPEILPKEQWYKVDVITCAAPNLREDSWPKDHEIMSNQELRNLHVKRMRRILDIAKMEQEDVVILGAFGCGAFANPSEVVAEAMQEVLEEYKYDFKTIEFAVFCTPKDSKNYTVFKDYICK